MSHTPPKINLKKVVIYNDYIDVSRIKNFIPVLCALGFK